MKNSVSQTIPVGVGPSANSNSLKGRGKRCTLRIVTIVALSGAYTLAGPAPAQATTTVGKQGSLVTVTATGVANTINVRRVGSFYEIWDNNDVNRTLAGCTRSGIIMRCLAAGVTRIVVTTAGGNDTVLVASSIGVRTDVFGGDGNDFVVSGGTNSDSLHGEAGNDTVWGGRGNDNLHGGLGDDLLGGEEDNDLIMGGPGRDQLLGGAGINIVNGEAGNDTLSLSGAAQGSNLNGGADNDTLVPSPSAGAVLSGGTGSDAVSYSNRTVPVRADPDGVRDDGAIAQATKDNILADVERLTGGTANDILTGSNAANVLTGLGGNDILLGLGGRDHLSGGTGNDTIVGGSGVDRLEGNDGNDRLDAKDVPVSKDEAYGGRGSDECFLDRVDFRQDCDTFP